MRKAGLAALEYRGDFRLETGYRMGSKILQEAPRPEALVTGNILMAAGALVAMQELGMETPRDLAFASFDSVPMLQGFQPRLTCVAQPAYRMGYDGANLLIDRLEGVTADSGPVHLVLPCELVVGGSTPVRIPQKTRRAGGG